MIYNIVGTLGALFILFGFYRVSTDRWTGKSLWYELDNFFGALLLFAYQAHHHAYITATLNVVWVTVAIRGLASYRQRQRRKKK